MNANKLTLVDISHVSKRGSSLRITIPRKVSEKLGINPEDILGFYYDGNEMIIEKVR
jgi:bifunctional DNA-binding transcriptional regulator/antitoxin component of YhaV-PrlF toxin-antitoxin module